MMVRCLPSNLLYQAILLRRKSIDTLFVTGPCALLGCFSWRHNQPLARSSQLIIKTNRGTEWGELLCPATANTNEYLGLKDEQNGKILRLSKPEDYLQREEIIIEEQKDFLLTKKIVQEHKLDMNIVDIERIFGSERYVVYYLAEKRIDFRELVKSLAKEFHTRIEMKHIGVRDEAKLLADYGDCGKPVCCNTHLDEMPPVSMKMAKLQKATLDPNKISGRCGRLKCCLRYEYDTYEEYQRELPSIGSVVLTKEGQGRVLGQEILAKKLIVEFEQHRRMIVDQDEVLTVVSQGMVSSDDDFNDNIE